MGRINYMEATYGYEVTLPNIKNLFIAEPGYVYIDVDLEQADAQVVAWEAECQVLKDLFHDETKDFHSENAFGFYEKIKGEVVDKYEVALPSGKIMVKAKDQWRVPLKAGGHATNYRTTAPTLAVALNCSIGEAEDFIKTWFILYPELKEWHERIEDEVYSRGYIENKFGFKRRFLGRITHNTLAEAQAWVPQSTVGNVINKGWTRIEKEINKHTTLTGPGFWKGKDTVIGAFQVHDSLVLKVRECDLASVLPDIRECMLVEIPYEDPLIIGVGQPEISKLSYGRCKPVNWDLS